MEIDLSVIFTGIHFVNPFLLAWAPPTGSDGNIMRAFEAGWGGVVTKTIGLHEVKNASGPRIISEFFDIRKFFEPMKISRLNPIQNTTMIISSSAKGLLSKLS
jgi:hypothetical protein